MLVLGSTCFQDPCHAYAQIYMPMLRSLCLCALYHVCVLRSICWLLCHMLLQPSYSLMSLFLMFWPSLVGCQFGSSGLGLHPYTQAYIKEFGSFPLCMSMFACLLLYFMSMFASLDLGFAMLILRSTCLCVPFHVYSWIYIFMLRSTCQCLDLCPFWSHVMFMLRSMFLSSSCHFVCLDLYVGCYAMCFYSPFVP